MNPRLSYESVPSDEEDNSLLKEKRSVAPRTDSHNGSRIWTVLVVLLFLNVLFASANAFYSIRTSQVLERYAKKDISQLRRPNPFIGLKLPKVKPGKNATDLDGY